MGRVHKKKLAEYAEAAENEELNKSNEDGGDDAAEETFKSSAVGAFDDDEKSSSADETDAEDEITLAAAKKVPDTGADGEADDDDEFQSLTGDDAGPEKNGKKSAPKRKSSEKAKAADDDDENIDDESLNGASPPKRGRKGGKAAAKAVVAKGKAGARGRQKAAAAKKPAPTSDSEHDDDDEDEEYEVKDIVDHKTERGVSYFLIRWKGYTKADDTWEPEHELSCPEIIEKYKKKQSPNGGGKSPKKAASPAKKGRGSGAAGSKTKEDPNKEWEVDKIIDYAQEKSGRVFRIRWKGFGPKYDTWEPEDNLYCDDIIKKFMKRMKSQENVSFKELREGPKKPRRLVNETAPRTNINNAIGRKSKRANTKKRVYYGDSDD